MPFIRLYGGPLIVTASRTVDLTPVQNCLLALACVEPVGTLTRERITWLLWEDGEDSKKRHSIRQLIYSINSRAGMPVLERTGEAVVRLLETDLAEVDPTDAPPLARLASAPTPSFERWLDGARERLRRARTRRLAARLDDEAASGNWTVATEIASRLCLLNRTSSDWIPFLVDSATRAGLPAACLAVLIEVSEAGGLDDSRLTTLKSLLRRAPSRSPTHATGGPIVGRQRELDWLGHQLSNSGLRFVAVHGDSGIGKTCLIEEAGFYAASEGLAVTAVHLSELSASVPLAGIRRVIAQTLEGGENRRVPEPWRSVLNTESGADEKGFEVLELGANTRRLEEAVRVALCEVTRDRSSLILIDDFQWIDETSLSLLGGLPSGWTGGPCTFLLAIRNRTNSQLDPRMAVFLREVRAERLHIRGLDADDCDRLLAQAGIDTLSEDERRQVIEIAGGNPLILVDLGRSWEDHRGLHAHSIPQTIQDLTKLRMQALARRDLEFLSLIAAVPGIASQQLAEVLGYPLWETVEALDSAVGADLVQLQGGGYSFRHSLLREAIASELGETRIREAHLRVARHLALYQSGTAEEIVHHFRQADSLAEAFTWAISAAREARDAGALVEAIGFYEIALEAPPSTEAPTLFAEAGKICLLLCQYEKGVGLLRQAEALCGTTEAMTWAVDRLNAMSEVGLASHEEVAQELETITNSAEGNRRWELALTAIETGIRVLERKGDWRGVKALIQRSAQLPVQDQPAAEIQRAMIVALGMVYGGQASALEAAHLAFKMAQEYSVSDILKAKAAHRLFVVLLSAGTVQTDVGRACINALEVRASRTGDLKLRYTSLANQAVWYLDTGDLETAERLLDEAEVVVLGSSAQNERQNLATNRGDLLLRRNNPEQALQRFEEAAALIQPGTRGFLRDLVNAGSALAKLRLGQFRAAERGLSEVRSYQHYYFDPSLLIRLRVEVLRHRRRTQEALGLLADEREKISQSFVPQYLSLTLWEAELRKRVGLPGGRVLISEVLEKSGLLGITQIEARARALIHHHDV